MFKSGIIFQDELDLMKYYDLTDTCCCYIGAESDVDEPSGGEVSEESLNSGNEDGKKKQKKLSKKNKSKKTYFCY